MIYEIIQVEKGYQVVVSKGSTELRRSLVFDTLLATMKCAENWIMNGEKEVFTCLI